MSNYLVNDLQAFEEGGLPWVCRHSTSGRGVRLHQTSGMDYHGMLFDTPQEALNYFIECESNDEGLEDEDED